MAFHFAAGCAEHPEGGDGADARAAGAGLNAIVLPNNGTFFAGRITVVLYFFLEVFFLSALRFAYRYFRYSRVRHHAKSEDASATLLVGRAADA